MQVIRKYLTGYKKTLWGGSYIVSTFFLICSIFSGIKGYSQLSNNLLIMTFILFLFSFFISVCMPQKLYLQFFPLYCIVGFFWDLAVLSDTTEKSNILIILIGLFSLNLPILILLVKCRKLLSEVKFRHLISENKFLILIICAFVVLSLPVIDSWPKLDSNVYYHYLMDLQYWNFSFDKLNLFMLGGHPSFGYTIIAGIGTFLTPNSPIGIRIINIILMCITLILFYNILSFFKTFKSNKGIRLLATAIFAVNPLVLGIIYEINLDFALTCFYIWVISALLNKKYIILAYTSFFLVFSKEIGIFLLFGIGIGWLLSFIVQNIKTKKLALFFSEEFIKIVMVFFLPAIVFVVFYIQGLLWRQSGGLTNTSSTLNSFYIDYTNIIEKLKQLFILNFNWFIFLFVILYLCILIFKRGNIQYKNFFELAPCTCFFSTLFFLLFQFIYVTYCNARYILPFIPTYIIFFAFITKKITTKQGTIILSLFLILSFVQNFSTIDPITKQAFSTIDVGKTNIITTRTFVKDSNGIKQTKETNPELIEMLQFTQSAVYNRQYFYFEKTVNEFFKKINYSNNQNVFIGILPTYGNMTWQSLFGDWYNTVLYYNKDTEKLVLTPTATTVSMEVLSQETIIDFEKYDSVYLMYVPFNKNYNAKDDLNKYNIVDQFEVTKCGFTINGYRIEK